MVDIRRQHRITADGTVNRPPAGSGDDTVTLLAVISKGIYSFVRVFTLIIVQNTEDLDVAYDLKALRIIYAPEDSAGSVTRDIMLPASGKNGCSIVWEADKPSIVNESGAVTRPEFRCDDDTVVLWARVSKGEFEDFKVCTLTVKAKLEPLCDIDGNLYETVKIGSQIWAMEDLRTTKFNDGTPIPFVTKTAEWSALAVPGYCHQFNRTNVICGLLYNWYAVNTGKIAPSGWHVPDEVDWDTLRNHLITHGYNWDGTRTGNKIAKSMASKEAWAETTEKGVVGCDVTINNSSGFSAAQIKFRDGEGGFDLGGQAIWWCASELDTAAAPVRRLASYMEGLEEQIYHKRHGFAVRLVKD